MTISGFKHTISECLDTEQASPPRKHGGGGRGGRMPHRGMSRVPRGGPPRFMGPGPPFPPMRPPFRHDGPPFDHPFDHEGPQFDRRGPRFDQRFGPRGPRGPHMEPPFSPRFGPRGPRERPGAPPPQQMPPGERPLRPKQPNVTLPSGPNVHNFRPAQRNQGKPNEAQKQAAPQKQGKQQNQDKTQTEVGKTRYLKC